MIIGAFVEVVHISLVAHMIRQELAAVFDSFDVEAILGYLSKVPRILVLVSKGSM